MSWRTDETGVPETCPLLDQAIELINNAVIHMESTDDWHEAKWLKESISILEQVRDHNGELRKFGIEQSDIAETLKVDIRVFEKELNELQAMCDS
jgi:hypothetical protein